MIKPTLYSKDQTIILAELCQKGLNTCRQEFLYLTDYPLFLTFIRPTFWIFCPLLISDNRGDCSSVQFLQSKPTSSALRHYAWHTSRLLLFLNQSFCRCTSQFMCKLDKNQNKSVFEGYVFLLKLLAISHDTFNHLEFPPVQVRILYGFEFWMNHVWGLSAAIKKAWERTSFSPFVCRNSDGKECKRILFWWEFLFLLWVLSI